MPPKKDDTPRSPAKARLFECAKKVAIMSVALRDTLDDHAIPDTLCTSAHNRLAAILLDITSIKVEVSRTAVAAAPQANSDILSSKQERSGLGKFGSLPPELRREVWDLLDRRDVAKISRLSRAANTETLPLLVADLRLNGWSNRLRQTGNVVKRLHDLQQLSANSLQIQGFGPTHLVATRVAKMLAPTLRGITISSNLYSSILAKIDMPELRKAELQLSDGLDLDELGLPCIADPERVAQIFEKFIPATEHLQYLKLDLALVWSLEDHGFPLEGVLDLRLNTTPLLLHHKRLQSLAIAACISHDIGTGTATLYFEPDVSGRQLPDLRVVAVHDRIYESLALSCAELRHIVHIAPNLTRLYLEAGWYDSHQGTGVHLPQMLGLKSLAIPRSWAQALRGSVQLDKLESLTLLRSYAVSPLPSLSGIGLEELTGAFSVFATSREQIVTFVGSGVLANSSIQHLRLHFPSNRANERDLFPDHSLPRGLRTLQLPGPGSAQLINGTVDQMKAYHELFEQLPALELVVMTSTIRPGAFARAAEPGADGLLCRWMNKDFLESKSFNKLFGTTKMYDSNWWDD